MSPPVIASVQAPLRSLLVPCLLILDLQTSCYTLIRAPSRAFALPHASSTSQTLRQQLPLLTDRELPASQAKGSYARAHETLDTILLTLSLLNSCRLAIAVRKAVISVCDTVRLLDYVSHARLPPLSRSAVAHPVHSRANPLFRRTPPLCPRTIVTHPHVHRARKFMECTLCHKWISQSVCYDSPGTGAPCGSTKTIIA